LAQAGSSCTQFLEWTGADHLRHTKFVALSAATSRGKPTFINFDRPYPNQDFTVMIWDDERAGFGSLERYTGRQVCAQGVITEYRGKPEMILRSPDALQAK
jgi:hypothetical protein